MEYIWFRSPSEPALVHEIREIDDQKLGIKNRNVEYGAHFASTSFDYVNESDPQGELYHSNPSYYAWSVTDDYALVCGSSSHSGASGQFSGLVLVKRSGDYLTCISDIAGGDRCHGSACIDFFKEGILQYRTSETPSTIMWFIHKEWDLEEPLQDLPDFPNSYGGEFEELPGITLFLAV